MDVSQELLALQAAVSELKTLITLAANSGVDIGDVTLNAGTALAGKVGIDQATANANEVVVKSGTITAVTGITNALPAGTNNMGDVDVLSVIDTLITKTRHPFAKGSLTTDGVQYCTPVTGIDNSAYVAVETITFQQPPGMTLEEIEFGLTGALGASGAVDAKLWKWQASDAGTDWEDLIAEQSLAAAAAYADVSCSGRFAPTGNFLGTGSSFQVRMVAKSAGATNTVNAKTKNSSYIICKYRRT